MIDAFTPDELSPEERMEMESAYAAMDAKDSRLPTLEEVEAAARALGLDEVPF